jgi:hypothetical protein
MSEPEKKPEEASIPVSEEKKEEVPILEKKKEELEKEKVKRSFVSEEDLKKPESDEKKEVLKIPPAEITLMYISKELKEINEKMGRQLAIFENAMSQLKPQVPPVANVVHTGVPTPEKPVEAKVPEVSARLAEVKLKLGESSNMLNFDEQSSAQYIKISPKQFLGAENFAKIASLIRNELGGQYVSQGKSSHFLVPKQKA